VFSPATPSTSSSLAGEARDALRVGPSESAVPQAVTHLHFDVRRKPDGSVRGSLTSLGMVAPVHKPGESRTLLTPATDLVLGKVELSGAGFAALLDLLRAGAETRAMRVTVYELPAKGRPLAAAAPAPLPVDLGVLDPPGTPAREALHVVHAVLTI
jgi:hypothetical protein